MLIHDNYYTAILLQSNEEKNYDGDSDGSNVSLVEELPLIGQEIERVAKSNGSTGSWQRAFSSMPYNNPTASTHRKKRFRCTVRYIV